MQYPGDGSPNLQLGQFRDFDVRVSRVLYAQEHSPRFDAEAFHGEFAVEHGDHDVAVCGFSPPITMIRSPSDMPACSIDSPATCIMKVGARAA